MNPGNSKKTPGKTVPSPSGAPRRPLPQPSGAAPPKGKPNPPRRPEQPTAGSDGQSTKAAGGQTEDDAGSSPQSAPKLPRRRETTQPPDPPVAPPNGGGTSRPERTKKPQTGRKVVNDKDETAPARTNIEAVKPALKRDKGDKEPSAKSARKLKNEAKKDSGHVKFSTEPEVTTAMPPTQPVEIKPAAKTWLTELPVKDFLVILGLWFIRFLIPWIYSWHDFNFHLLREPSYWDPLEKETRTQEIIAFCGMSVITVLVSVIADFINCRFFIFLVLLLLFILSPYTGGILNHVLVTRAYDQDFYRRWAFTSDALFHWALDIALFVSFPIQMSCIFGQNDAMSRNAHYNWTAALVFLESINVYVAFWVIPGKCPTRTFTQSAIWFLIGVIILMALILISNFALEWAKPEITQFKWYFKESTKFKEQDNEDVAANRRKKFIWFSSVLSFLILTSCVFATLERLRPDEDWDKHSILSATSMFLLGKILGAVFMVVALTIVRWKLQFYYTLPFLRPDVLALGLSHMINLIALIALLGRYATLSHLKEGEVIIGPIPENKKMVVEFYNFDYRNRTVCVHSNSFRPIKISPRQRGTREIYESGLSRIYFRVTLDPRTTPGLVTAESFEYREDTWATFVITLPFSNIKYSDVQALYSKPEIVRVEGTQRLRPKKEPQIYFMNTFVTQNATASAWMFLVKQIGSSFQYEFRYNLRWQTVIIEVPNGNLEITYYLVNSTSPSKTTVSTTTVAEGYSVLSVLLGHSRPMKQEEIHPPRMLKAFRTMETAGTDSVRLPSKAQLQRDLAIMAGMTLAGMASSGIFIGVIYLFWLDTPYVAFRTTCIAVFWVLLSTPAQLSNVKVVDISFLVISVLAFLQIICTVMHFMTAKRLYAPEFNFRKRPD